MSERIINLEMALELGIFVVLGLIALLVILMQKMDGRKK